MPTRVTLKSWRQTLWKFITHPATEAAAVVALAALSVWVLATTEARFVRSLHSPVIFAPR